MQPEIPDEILPKLKMESSFFLKKIPLFILHDYKLDA